MPHMGLLFLLFSGKPVHCTVQNLIELKYNVLDTLRRHV